MKKTVKLTKEWNGFTAGTILEVDAQTFDTIIKNGSGNEVKADGKQSDASPTEERIAAVVSDVVEKRLSELLDKRESKMQHITVHDKSDDDPTFGFLPGNNKNLKELRKEEIQYAFGRFAADVAKATISGRESETLMKCRERSERMIRKAAGDGMVVGSDAEGGYLIFSAASQMIQAAALETSIVRPNASKITMSTQLLRLPYLRDVDHSSGTVYGGIAVYMDGELDQYTSSKPKLGALELKLKKMTALGYVSDEWIKWSPVTLGSWLVPKFGEAIGWKEDLLFLTGAGGSQPVGILNANCKIEVSRESGQTPSTFILENSTAMFARLLVKRSDRCVWLMNRGTFPQLPLFNVAVGTGGAPVFVNNAQGAPGQSLWGYPVQFSEKIPALGTAGAVVLTDLSDYLVGDDQSGPEIAQSIHLKFDYGQVAFRLTKYIDGLNETEAAFQGRYGSTLSPVVMLAA